MSYRLFFLLLFYATCSLAAQEDAAIAKAQALLDAAVTNGHCVGVAAGIMTKGEITWQGRAGSTTLTGKEGFTENTPSRIASITKPMTAVAILQLVAAGQLELDTPVGQYLPAFSTGSKAAITVRHVLQHAAGIRAYANGKESNNRVHYATLAEAMSIFAADDLAFAPGTDFAYTSYGYVVLGRLIEEVSGMGYEAYLRKHVWEPAGMTETFVERSDDQPLYHQRKPGKIKAVPATDLSDRIPGGGVRSSALDLLRFGEAVLNGTLLQPVSLAVMTEDSGLKKEGNGYGMGWYLYGESEPYGKLFGHNGAQLGSSSFLMLAPESGTIVVILANTSGAGEQVGSILNGLLSIGQALRQD